MDDTSDLEQILGLIGEPETIEAVRPHWEESQRTLPEERPGFLAPAEIADCREYVGMGGGADAALIRTAERIASNPALRRLMWHWHYLEFEHADRPSFAGWPTFEKALGDDGGVFYLLGCLAAVPRIRAAHRVLRVPEEITRDTSSIVAMFANRYARGHGGRPGVFRQEAYWIRHHVAATMFRLGRMEYRLRDFSGTVEVYRNRRSREVVALARDGLVLNREGYLDGADGIHDPLSWTASCATDGETVKGHGVSPFGMALRNSVSLPLSDWEHVLGPDTLMLEMHIPPGGGMTPEACLDSMQRAFEFFPAFFPDQRPIMGIQCASWIFNNQLEQILPEASNLVRFLREGYLFPVPTSRTGGLFFIFYQERFDLATAPRDTSLQRAIADWIAAGNVWREGGWFFLKEDLARFGTQFYRRQWPPAVPGASAGDCG